MGKRVKYQQLKGYKYYSVNELSEILDVSNSSVKYWAHHGLSPMNRNERKWYFLGKDVKEYLKIKNNKFKFKLADYELLCLSCRSGVTGKKGSIKLDIKNKIMGKRINNYSIMIFGNCSKCNSECYRVSSSYRVPDFLVHYGLTLDEFMDKSSNQKKV